MRGQPWRHGNKDRDKDTLKCDLGNPMSVTAGRPISTNELSEH